MSNETYNLEQNESNSNSGVSPYLPRGIYKWRITKEPTAAKSKLKPGGGGGNDYLLFDVEVVDPGTVIVRGEEITVAGSDSNIYATFVKGTNLTLAAIHRAGGLPLQFEVDEKTKIPLDASGTPFRYTGIEFQAQGYSQEYVQKDDNGVELVNPMTGEVLKSYNRRVGHIFA